MSGTMDVWNPWRGFMPPLAGEQMPVHVEELGDAYEVTAELPGVEKEDLRVDIYDEGVRISGESASHVHEEVEGRREVRSQRRSMARFIPLHDFDPAGVEGRYKDGLLTLRAPKSEARGRQLELR